MPQATFTPKYLNPPKGNARSASIKDSDGGYWGCHPGDLNKFQAGVPVTVEYSTSESNGRTYYNIKSVVGQRMHDNPQTRGQQPPRGVSASGQNSRPQTNPQADPRKSEDIFVCGAINHAISHQSLPIEALAITQAIQILRSAWRAGEPSDFPGSAEPPPSSEDDYYRG